jgi:bifunctional non-homologous end joining protein LigD
VDPVRVAVGGRELRLTNLDKVLYPAAGLTKAGVIDYYGRVSGALLPHVRDRALTLLRCPDGVDGERFVEKRCPPGAPDWVRTGGPQGSVVADEPATLVWLANLAALELHAHQHTVSDPERPRAVIFDLDPGPPAGLAECARLALELRDALETLGLRSLVKTSGSKGLHVSVPLEPDGRVGARETKAFALAVADVLARRAPDRVVTEMARAARDGKVFIDWSQNDAAKTTVVAYSLRARERPWVSTPLRWDEVEAAVRDDAPAVLRFEPGAVLERLQRHGDLWAANAAGGQHLPRREAG